MTRWTRWPLPSSEGRQAGPWTPTSASTLTRSTGTGWSGSSSIAVGDRRVVRLIRKWLNAGVLQDGARSDSGTGKPQGAIVSPVLANVFLHFVLDPWMHRKWRPHAPRGEVRIVRYADDFVVGFQYKQDAERFMDDLRERLAKFGLRLHPKKTRLVEFGRFAAANRARRGQGRPETFDFLGFTHFVTTTKRGRFRLGASRSRRGWDEPCSESGTCCGSAATTTSGKWATGSDTW